MSWTSLRQVFPRLTTADAEIKSPTDIRYNCVAFSLDDRSRWYDPQPGPGRFWPAGLPRNADLATFIELFRRYGYEDAADGSPEEGYDKIVVYSDGARFSHVAKLLDSGVRWSSKLGKLEDIEHANPGVLVPPYYGLVMTYLRRRRPIT